MHHTCPQSVLFLTEQNFLLVARSLVSQVRFCFCAQLANNLWQVFETIGSRFSS